MLVYVAKSRDSYEKQSKISATILNKLSKDILFGFMIIIIANYDYNHKTQTVYDQLVSLLKCLCVCKSRDSYEKQS